MRRRSIRSKLIAALVVSTILVQWQAAEAAQSPQGKPLTIRGKIASVEKDALKVTTSAGEVMIKLPQDIRVTGVEAAKLSDISSGEYVGTTAVKQPDGNLKAFEVHIFPESSRATGEGHRPWDLTPGSTMTHANVEKVAKVPVERTQGDLLKLKYKDGEQKVLVPPGSPIVKNVAGDRSLLKPGTGVYIAAVRGDDGTITVTRTTASVGGVMPPM
jgi:hypothetical protein